MPNITAPRDAESVSFEPTRSREDIANAASDAAIVNGPPLADEFIDPHPQSDYESQAAARASLDPIVREQLEDDRLGDEIAFDAERQDAQDALDAKVNSEIVRRGQVRSEFNRGEEQFAGQVEDYREVVYDPDITVTPILRKEVLAAPDGSRVLYNLISDPARLDRANDLTDPVAVRRELNLVRQDMGLPPARNNQTNAAAPVPTLRGGGATVQRSPDKMSYSEYAAGRRSGKIK